MCTPQVQQLAQFVAEQRALDAGIRPEDAAANGGQYGVLPRRPGQSIADAVAEANQPVHMMRSEISQMPNAPVQKIAPIPMAQPIQRTPTVGEILGIKPGTYQEVVIPPSR